MSTIRRVAIVGAGNAGITAAKYLLAERRFSKIDIFEQRNHVGGLWQCTPVNDREASFTIPQTTADAPHEEPIWRARPGVEGFNGMTNGTDNGDHGYPRNMEPTFVSPMYERLEANLPKMIMNHCDMSFPDDAQLFPSHQTCAEYLERYAEDVRHLIRFETQIRRIQQNKTEDTTTTWTLSIKNLRSSRQETLKYDAVIIASGHFTVPFVPDIPGIRKWDKLHPGTLDHSKFFRRPEDYAGKKVLTLGRGYSGLDIASQIAPHCTSPLLISTRQPPSNEPIPLDRTFIQKPSITSLDPSTRTAHFADGTSESNIDSILFCTGYLYSYPFFPPGSLLDDSSAPIATEEGDRPHNLYQYIFYNASPSLAFLSIPQQIVPFPVCDAQAAVVARVWAGRLELPKREEMVRWERETLESMGEGKKWLWLKPPRDGVYLNLLARWADRATEGRSVEGALSPEREIVKGGEVVNDKPPARWGEKEIWMRERIQAIKKAFVDLGEERHECRTLEELGFDFEKWTVEQAELRNEDYNGNSG